jgi:mannose-6-phosphate isomerase-like protein (cupin superfamily)
MTLNLGGFMPRLMEVPTVIQSAGNKPKRIEEFFGMVNSQTQAMSLARMVSPGGWEEPGQTPEFDEYTLVLRGMLHVRTQDGSFDVVPNQAIFIEKGEWVQYSTPLPEGAEYISACVPAFSPETVHRDSV